jgi:DNA replication protein DnaC
LYQYDYKQDACWYINSCSQFNTSECSAACIRYMEMHYLMWQSNIPVNMQYPKRLRPVKEDLEAFKKLDNIKNAIVPFVNNGQNLYIFSTQFGNGKTTWAIRLMQKYFDEIWAGNGFRRRGVFVHVPTLLTKMKENISKRSVDFEDMRDSLSAVDLVIWDDIAATKLSDYDHTTLLTYIDQRKLAGLSNIYTGNLTEEELPAALGNRLASRVGNDSMLVEFVGCDRRGIL